ncbi:MAG: type I secretion C-terminal target domain-containing protein, partial [Halioglobus sp.]|nr:type I secretion C-terminal target domain-containing protein [Halioglobus sp.]
DSEGNYAYTVDPGAGSDGGTETDTFEYTVTDADGDSVTNSITFTLSFVANGPNVVPVVAESGTDIGYGVSVDGIIEGMIYQTSSGLSGRTDAEGRFAYRAGDTISFSVGAIMIGSFNADEALGDDGKVFLQEIAGVGLDDMNDDYVENMAILLQSLDNDGDAYNGIVINESIHEALSDDSFDLKTISKSDLAEVLEENGYTPVDEDDAMQHVRDMIEEHVGITNFEARTENVFATDADDVFAFELNDEGQAGEDVTISGFGDAGSDSLDLRDLLIGEEAGGADLTSFLNVSFDGANTVIEVSSSGGFAEGSAGAVSVDQTITLEGVDLVGSDELSTVIQNMLNNGQMITD